METLTLDGIEILDERQLPPAVQQVALHGALHQSVTT